MRSKWDEQRGDQPYGEMTIQKVCQMNGEGFGGDMLSESTPNRVISPVIKQGTRNVTNIQYLSVNPLLHPMTSGEGLITVEMIFVSIMADSEVGEFFESNLDEYSVGLKDGSEQKLNFIRETVGDGTEIRALDIGCGSGIFADMMAESLENHSVFGTEIARGMISEQAVNVNFLISDAQDLPFESNAFRLIHMDTVLHHIVGKSRTESKKKPREHFQKYFGFLNREGIYY